MNGCGNHTVRRRQFDEATVRAASNKTKRRQEFHNGDNTDEPIHSLFTTTLLSQVIATIRTDENTALIQLPIPR
jgi:hypothetical protein